MANNTQAFERTDRALADTFNENLVDPINVMVLEHNTHIASTDLHMSTAENTSFSDLTDGTDTTLHTHVTSGITGFATAVRGMVLTGLSTATNAVITATDTILSALGKLQKQITDHKTDYTLQVPYAGTTTGTANTYVLASPTISALSAGMAVSVRFNLDSTAASTLNWCGLGAKAIKKANGTSVTNLKATGIYTLRYDGTNFILQGEGASGDATASDLISGKTATVDAGEITGTMVNNGAVAVTPSTVQQAIPVGYHNGSGYVVGDADLVAANIIPIANIFNVQGTFSNIKSVQRGTASIVYPDGYILITINEVIVNSSIVKLTGDIAQSTAPSQSLLKATFVSSTQIKIEIGVAGPNLNNIAWEVVEFNNVKSKQTITYSTPSALTSGTITISAVQLSKALLFFSRTTTTSTAEFSIGSLMVYASGVNELTFYKKAGVVFNSSIQIIEFN